MLIKVCGMRDPQNIRALQDLDVNLMGMIFWSKSPRYISDINVHAGIIPNEAILKPSSDNTLKAKLVGVFVNEMPQTVITHAYNYKLDYLQLHGAETPTYIDNLKRTLIPDILPNIKIIKAISVKGADDVNRWREYEGHADMLLFDTKCKTMGGSGEQFDWSVLSLYDGNMPFLLSGGIGPEDVQRVKDFSHPQCVGIDLNSRFEISPAMKDIKLLEKFINELKQ